MQPKRSRIPCCLCGSSPPDTSGAMRTWTPSMAGRATHRVEVTEMASSTARAPEAGNTDSHDRDHAHPGVEKAVRNMRFPNLPYPARREKTKPWYPAASRRPNLRGSLRPSSPGLRSHTPIVIKIPRMKCHVRRRFLSALAFVALYDLCDTCRPSWPPCIRY